MTAKKKLMAILVDRNLNRAAASDITKDILAMFAEIKVTVLVKDGVAEVTHNPCGVTVNIDDRD